VPKRGGYSCRRRAARTFTAGRIAAGFPAQIWLGTVPSLRRGSRVLGVIRFYRGLYREAKSRPSLHDHFAIKADKNLDEEQKKPRQQNRDCPRMRAVPGFCGANRQRCMVRKHLGQPQVGLGTVPNLRRGSRVLGVIRPYRGLYREAKSKIYQLQPRPTLAATSCLEWDTAVVIRRFFVRSALKPRARASSPLKVP